MNMSLTQHAKARMQQRGIPEFVLDSLFDFGRESHDHRGSAVLFFDHNAKRRLRRSVSPDAFKRIETHLDAYAVIAQDGSVVTVGHRTHRINRD